MTLLKYPLLAVICLLANSVQAQHLSWTSPGNQWHYDFLIARSTETNYISLSVTRDTTIDERRCTILTPYSPVPEAVYEYSREIIIYEKDGIVEQYADGDFHLLYNFNLAVGDVYDVYIPHHGFPPSGLSLRVDTVTTKIIGSREIRAQYVTVIAGTGRVHNFSGWNYEYFGNRDIYFIPVNQLSCDGGCPRGQLCFSSPEGEFEVSLTDRPCDTVFTSVYLPDVSELLRVYPNPAASGQELVLSLPEQLVNHASELRLFNQLGQLVLQKSILPRSTLTTLGLPALPGGVYYLLWQSPNARARKKIVVANR